MRHPVINRVERPAVVEVRCVNGVAGGAQSVGETADGIRKAESVMETTASAIAEQHTYALALPACLVHARTPGPKPFRR
jgi:hypothetical protein